MRVDRQVLLAAALAIGSSPALGQSGWRQIGAATAGADSASVNIAAHDDGAYREYMVCVEQGPIRLTGTVLHYRDNRTVTIRLHDRVGDGSCSRAATLGGRDRTIASLDVGYDSASLQDRHARLELYVR
jgi:hypothetical protein